MLILLLGPLVIHSQVFVEELLAEVFVNTGQFCVKRIHRVFFAIFDILTEVLCGQVLQRVALLTSQTLLLTLGLNLLVLNLLACLHLLVQFHYSEQTDESDDSNNLDDFGGSASLGNVGAITSPAKPSLNLS